MLLVLERHEELEIDLHAQGVDLLDLWRGTLTWRRLDVLIRHLPATSSVVRAVDPDAAVAAAWTVGDEIAATHFDAYMQVHFKNPRPFPRPADAARERRRTEARHAALERQQQRLNGRR